MLRRQLLPKSLKADGGFTFIELLVVIIMIGIISAIAAPGWLGYLERRRLSTAQDEIYQALKQTQLTAERTARDWRFAIRQEADKDPEWTVYPNQDGALVPVDIDPTNPASDLIWNELSSTVELDTTATTNVETGAGGDYYRGMYDFQGNATDQLTVVLNSKNSSQLKRCVIMSTLLGAVRKASDNDCP